MATYAIGDIQGCYRELLALLERIAFDPMKDILWFAGDLVNRGPQSLEVLRFVASLKDHAVCVLGNHDLHLLAVHTLGTGKLRKKDTLDAILKAPDREPLLDWLRHRPLFHYDTEICYALVHAGLSPHWDIATAGRCANEVESVLRGQQSARFFAEMYGDQPDVWDEGLDGWERLRFITNCLTRARYCTKEGRLDLSEKGPPGEQGEHLMPWYTVPWRKSRGQKVIFGHWSTLVPLVLGRTDDYTKEAVYPLDTGCVWGRELTAMRLHDQALFSVGCMKD